MAKKIIVERSKCIGCGTCSALCSKYFELDEEGKTHLKGSKLNKDTDTEELEVEEVDCIQEAANACPVQAIHIK